MLLEILSRTSGSSQLSPTDEGEGELARNVFHQSINAAVENICASTEFNNLPAPPLTMEGDRRPHVRFSDQED